MKYVLAVLLLNSQRSPVNKFRREVPVKMPRQLTTMNLEKHIFIIENITLKAFKTSVTQ
jgi:hypothetical protein